MENSASHQYGMKSTSLADGGCPAIKPPLDPEFYPIALGNRNYRLQVRMRPDREPLCLSLERDNGRVSTWRGEIPAGVPGDDPDTLRYVERMAKFILWQYGGWKLGVSGSPAMLRHLQSVYSRAGARAFDVNLMERVYEKAFRVEWRDDPGTSVPADSGSALGGHLEGARIGFDLGASDYKLAAVLDGEPVFATEVPWDPRNQSDPEWHYHTINEGLKLAAAHLPRVDAIGGSSAGIYIDNQVRVASLFRAVPEALFEEKVRGLFNRLRDEWQVPLVIINDGDVTALAGGLSLKKPGILGVAMGSSEAVGYLDPQGRITGWLNELAFAPVDYRPESPLDEWSGDIGCGVQYFSQQAVVRLARQAGLDLPAGHPAEQLRHVQERHGAGDPVASRIFESIGVYLGYAVAQYAEHYDFQDVLILGRVTSGRGGDVILRRAGEVLAAEFPELRDRIGLNLPDEKSKRVGQAVAAASLPKL